MRLVQMSWAGQEPTKKGGRSMTVKSVSVK